MSLSRLPPLSHPRPPSSAMSKQKTHHLILKFVLCLTILVKCGHAFCQKLPVVFQPMPSPLCTHHHHRIRGSQIRHSLQQPLTRRQTRAGGVTMFAFKEALIYEVQKIMTGSILQQMLGIIAATVACTFMGGVLLYALNPDKEHASFRNFLTTSYAMMNRVPLYVFDAPRKRMKVMKNILFLSNILTISLVTEYMVLSACLLAIQLPELTWILVLLGIVAASMKTWLDSVINGNGPVRERGPQDDCLNGRPIVLLSPQDKHKVQSAISNAFALEGHRPNVIVRSGDPLNMADLEKACVAEAAKVLYISSHEGLNSEGAPTRQKIMQIQTEAAVLKTVRGSGEYWRELEADFAVCEEQEFVGRLIALCAHPHNKGLAQVYNEVFQEEGSELYTSRSISPSSWPELLNLPFASIQGVFPHSVVCGIVRDGHAKLAPPPDLTIQENDKLVLFAEFPSFAQPDMQQLRAKYQFPGVLYLLKEQATPLWQQAKAALMPAGAPNAGSGEPGSAQESKEVRKGVERERVREKGKVLMLGWNERAEGIISDIHDLMQTSVSVLAHNPPAQKDWKSANINEGNYFNQKDLVAAGALSCDCVVVISDTETASNTSPYTDSELLATVEALTKLPWPSEARPRVVAMVFDPKARDLIAQKCLSNGFAPELIMSDALEAGALTQVLLRPELEEVFNTLLTSTGVLAQQRKLLPSYDPLSPYALTGSAELRIKPLETFFPEGVFKGSVRQLQEATAALSREITIGVLTQDKADSSPDYTVRLNPPAGQQLDLGPGSRLVVIEPA